MTITTEDLVYGIIGGILGVILLLVINQGLKKAEYEESLKLKRQSEINTLFYLTDVEYRMCKEREVEIDAPVK